MLPKVNPEIGCGIIADISGKSDKQLLNEELRKIKRENPIIAKLIKNWSRLQKGDSKLHSAFCGLLVYKMLKNQSQVNDMEDEINLG